jgi:predicted  nucleic acid-binding Zn-ribbon protein
MLCSHIPGAAERIERARERFEQLSESLENYEALVDAQKAELDLLHGRSGGGEVEDEEDDAMDGVVYEDETAYLRPGEEMVTEEMIRREEEEIGELERKKAELEARIRNADRR